MPLIFHISSESHKMLNTSLQAGILTVLKWTTSKYLSLHFNGHFPGEPGLAGVYWSKGWWRWWWQLDYWSYKSCKAPVKSSSPTNQHSVFYRPDALPVAQPTVSKHWRENITCTCLPQAHQGVFQLCLWPIIAPGYLGGGLPWLSSALWCQYPNNLEVPGLFISLPTPAGLWPIHSHWHNIICSGGQSLRLQLLCISV